MPTARRQTSLLRVQVHWRSREELCCHRARVTSRSMGPRETTPLHIWQKVQTPDRPEATRNDL